MQSATQEYVVDEKGRRKAVILPWADYQRLQEDLHDLAVVAERRNEAPVSLADVKARLKADGLL